MPRSTLAPTKNNSHKRKKREMVTAQLEITHAMQPDLAASEQKKYTRDMVLDVISRRERRKSTGPEFLVCFKSADNKHGVGGNLTRKGPNGVCWWVPEAQCAEFLDLTAKATERQLEKTHQRRGAISTTSTPIPKLAKYPVARISARRRKQEPEVENKEEADSENSEDEGSGSESQEDEEEEEEKEKEKEKSKEEEEEDGGKEDSDIEQEDNQSKHKKESQKNKKHKTIERESESETLKKKNPEVVELDSDSSDSPNSRASKMRKLNNGTRQGTTSTTSPTSQETSEQLPTPTSPPPTLDPLTGDQSTLPTEHKKKRRVTRITFAKKRRKQTDSDAASAPTEVTTESGISQAQRLQYEPSPGSQYKLMAALIASKRL